MLDVSADKEEQYPLFDEYLWPLTDAAWPLDLRRLANEQRLRQRLSEILAHVHQAHVAPRIRRLGAAHASAVIAISQRIVSGPLDGEYWERTLHEPVPRALREEWISLSAELRALCEHPRHVTAAAKKAR
jgi:hypothetical protein